jgi:hypothetical protein
MGSSARSRVFDPLDLQVIDLVYEAAWAQLEARDPFRDIAKDPKRQEALRRKVFAVAVSGPVEFDSLLDKVLGISQEAWVKELEHVRQQPVPTLDRTTS